VSGHKYDLVNYLGPERASGVCQLSYCHKKAFQYALLWQYF